MAKLRAQVAWGSLEMATGTTAVRYPSRLPFVDTDAAIIGYVMT
jgi:hypothetical protein